MNGLITFTLAIAIASFVSMAFAKKMLCDGHEMKEIIDDKEVTAALTACLDKYAPATKIADDASEDDKKKALIARQNLAVNTTCYHVCIMKVDKIFDKDDKFSPSDYDAHTDKEYPTTDLANQVKKEGKKCTEGLTFSMENECASYLKFIFCEYKKVVKICKLDAKTEEA